MEQIILKSKYDQQPIYTTLYPVEIGRAHV